MKIVAVDANPRGPGKTHRMLLEILAGASAAGAETQLVRHDDENVLDVIRAANGVVFGSPTYRAAPTSAMRLLLENINADDAGQGPLQNTPAIVAMTGASTAHFLSTRELSNALTGFFGLQVLSPDIYLDPSAFSADGTVNTLTKQRLRRHGAALTELVSAIGQSKHLQMLRPWI